MNRLGKGLLVTGIIALFWAVIVGILGLGGAGGTAVQATVAIVGFYGALIVLYLLVSSANSEAGISWTDVGPLTERAPERTPSTYPLAGDTQLDIERACQTARNERDVEAGLTVIRGPLQRFLVDGLVASGQTRQEARQRIRDGSWTDDEIAQVVLSAEVEPALSARQTLREWLFPGKVVRAWTGQTVARVAETVEDSIPTVVGQNAPRRIPVRPPTLEEQRRSATGEIEPAAESSVGYRWENVPDTNDGPGGPEENEKELDSTGSGQSGKDTRSDDGQERQGTERTTQQEPDERSQSTGAPL